MHSLYLPQGPEGGKFSLANVRNNLASMKWAMFKMARLNFSTFPQQTVGQDPHLSEHTLTQSIACSVSWSLQRMLMSASTEKWAGLAPELSLLLGGTAPRKMQSEPERIDNCAWQIPRTSCTGTFMRLPSGNVPEAEPGRRLAFTPTLLRQIHGRPNGPWLPWNAEGTGLCPDKPMTVVKGWTASL